MWWNTNLSQKLFEGPRRQMVETGELFKIMDNDHAAAAKR
jgi:hypothetical protein